MVLFVVLFVVLLVMAVADMLMPADRRQVVVTETELLVGRRWRVTTIARPDVRAVRGDVLDRPTWSDRVVVEHAGGEMRLPRYEEPPAVVVRRLQEWAGVGERPAAPAGAPPVRLSPRRGGSPRRVARCASSRRAGAAASRGTP